MKIAVLGSGNGAHAVAFECAQKGHDVYMYDFPQFSKSIDAIAAAGGIYANGKLQGFQKIAYAGTDISKVVPGAELIFAVGPSYSTEPFAKVCAPYVTDGQRYIIMPGSCMGALTFKNALGLDIKDNRISVSETNTLPYAVRISAPATIEVHHKLLAAYTVATLPRAEGQKVFDLLKPIFGGIEKAESVLQTTLSNSNPIIHPVITTLNAALIERTGGDFMFYHEGVTPAVGNLMEAFDNERASIGAGLGLFVEKSPEKGMRQGFHDYVEKDYAKNYGTSPGFAGIKAQSSLDHRYYTEDLGCTMIFWIELAERIGVDVPAMKSLVTIVSLMMKRDFRAECPRSLASLGLGDYTKEDLLNF